MILEVTTDIKLNDYSTTFNIKDITEIDLEKLSDFGMIEIEIGGTIPLPLGSSFVLSNSNKTIPSDFPFTKVFKSNTYGALAESYADAYVAEITKRIQDAIADLNTKTDTFSGIKEIQL